jgi:hypothetical protein
VPHSCATSPATCPLTTALGLKADQADLDTLTVTVGTKAAQAALETAESTLTAAIGTKAAQADLDSLTTTVGTKAAQADLDTLSATVAASSGLPDVIYDGSNIDTWVASLGSGLPGIYTLRLSGDAQTFVIPSALALAAGQDARIVSTATSDSTLTFSSIISLQNGALLSTDGSIRFNCLALYYFADPRMNAGQVTFGTGASIVCTGDATADLSGELPGTATVTPSAGGGAVTVSRSGSSAFVPTEQQVPWVGAVAMFDGSTTMIRAPRARAGGSFILYQLASLDFTGSGSTSSSTAAADRALYVAACTAAGLRTLSASTADYDYDCEDVNCLGLWEGSTNNLLPAIRHYSSGAAGWTGG